MRGREEQADEIAAEEAGGNPRGRVDVPVHACKRPQAEHHACTEDVTRRRRLALTSTATGCVFSQ